MVVVITSTRTRTPIFTMKKKKKKNTSQATICDKIERFLQIQAHFQAV